MDGLRCGIEFEYLLVDREGPQAGRIRDFRSLDFAALSAVLADKPGCTDPSLATGDMGIRRGYWYLEGDERFAADGAFATLAVKGVEIRTPPQPSVAAAIDSLLTIERQLSARLLAHGLGLAVAGFNPWLALYEPQPPFNAFERALRASDHEYDGTEVSTLSYGPDINLSLAGWDSPRCLDVARKLNHYAPFIVPFSFSSPLQAGCHWLGLSYRTWVRCRCRPAVKFFVAAEEEVAWSQRSTLARPARLVAEVGRIEFKAFDALLSMELLDACCQLLLGLCLDTTLPARSESSNVSLYQRAALDGFEDEDICAGATAVLNAARAALQQHGEDAAALAPLFALLAARRTPAHALRDTAARGAPPYRSGGLGEAGPAHAYR